MENLELFFSKLEAILGSSITTWVILALGVLVIASLVIRSLREITRALRPSRASGNQRKHREIALIIENQIKQLIEDERWCAIPYVELRIEVKHTQIDILTDKRKVVRFHSTLEKVVNDKRIRTLLLEGAPGSGKSIALRHLAYKLAQKAKKARGSFPSSPVPIYLNLRDLKRDPNEPVTRALIEKFVIRSLSEYQLVDQYLKETFLKGLEIGSWFFIFDSFDEIPEILSSTNVDQTIRSYADALMKFLGGGNHCRSIVSSRHYKGPDYIAWDRAMIQDISQRQREKIVKTAGLDKVIEANVLNQLRKPSLPIQNMIGNPLLFVLIIEYVRSGKEFPHSTYRVIDNFVSSRKDNYQTNAPDSTTQTGEQIQIFAETLAYQITSDARLGLRSQVRTVKIIMESFGWSGQETDQCLRALSEMRILNIGTAHESYENQELGFVHRRFQEYFATSHIRRHSDLLRSPEMLTDGRWRETIVTLFQEEEQEALQPLLTETQNLLVRYSDEIISSTGNALTGKLLLDHFSSWISALYIFEMLQEGFRYHLESLPVPISQIAARLVRLAWEHGSSIDKKWALEVIGIVPAELALPILNEALGNSQNKLNEIAFWQTPQFGQLTDEIRRRLYLFLISGLSTGTLDASTVKAYQSGFQEPLLSTMLLRALRFMDGIDSAITGVMLGVTIYTVYYSVHQRVVDTFSVGIMSVLIGLAITLVSLIFILPLILMSRYTISLIWEAKSWWGALLLSQLFALLIAVGAFYFTRIVNAPIFERYPFLFFFIIYLLLFRPLSYILVHKKQIPRNPIAWLFMPLISVLIIIDRFIELIRAHRKWNYKPKPIKGGWRINLIQSMLMLIIFCSPVALCYLLTKTFTSTRIQANDPSSAGISLENILFLLAGLLVITFIILVTISVNREEKEYIGSIDTSKPEILPSELFWKKYYATDSLTLRRKYVSIVREHNLLMSEENLPLQIYRHIQVLEESLKEPEENTLVEDIVKKMNKQKMHEMERKQDLVKEFYSLLESSLGKSTNRV